MNTFPKNQTSVSNEDMLEQEHISATKESDSEVGLSTSANMNMDNAKNKTRKSKYFHPIIMVFMLMMLVSHVFGQVGAAVEVGAVYTDNAFQLSEYDLQRNEDNHADLKFVDSADDVIINAKLSADYATNWRWWQIQPYLQVNAYQNVLNTDKHRFESIAGLKIRRRFGELGLSYGYYPENYIRYYNDNDGSGEQEKHSYDKNLYRAELKVKPLRKTTLSLDYRLEQYYYNKFFTEFDGDITTWTFGAQQSFPTFYLDAAYSFKEYQTEQNKDFSNPEDASYESNVYSFGIMIKKMLIDTRYPNLFWRPNLDLRFEERYYQGSDNWHAARTDNINRTDTSLMFYYGSNWNINLDYSHIFRNVDAPYSSVRKYKEYSENRFGVSVKYLF